MHLHAAACGYHERYKHQSVFQSAFRSSRQAHRLQLLVGGVDAAICVFVSQYRFAPLIQTQLTEYFDVVCDTAASYLAHPPLFTVASVGRQRRDPQNLRSPPQLFVFPDRQRSLYDTSIARLHPLNIVLSPQL